MHFTDVADMFSNPQEFHWNVPVIIGHTDTVSFPKFMLPRCNTILKVSLTQNAEPPFLLMSVAVHLRSVDVKHFVNYDQPFRSQRLSAVFQIFVSVAKLH